MPVLNEDGTIVFESAEEFLTQYQENIVNNGLMVETKDTWTLRENRTFMIKVPPLEDSVALAAEVVFLGDGQAGLEITADVETFQALAQLMADLLTTAPPPRSTEEMEPVREKADTTEVSTPQAYRPPRSKKPTQPVTLDRDRNPAAISETQTLQAVSAREPRRKSKAPAISLSGELVISNDMDNYKDSSPIGLEPEKLGKIRLPCLIATIAKAQVPISLTVETEEVGPVSLHFNLRGNLVKLINETFEERMLERFTRAGLVNKELLNEVQGMVDATRSAEEILLYRKIIRPREYWVAIREMTIEYLMSIHRGGSTTFQLKSEMVKRRTGIPYGSLIIPWMQVALRNLDIKAVDDFLDPLWFQYPCLSESAPWALQSLDVDQRTLRFLEKALTGRDPLVHVRKTSPQGTNTTKRLFATMMSIGLVELTDKPKMTDEGQTPAAKLAEDLRRRKKANRFDQLGVHWSSHPNQFKKAVEDLKKEYGPKSKWDRFYPETRESCKGLIALAEDAAKYLRDRGRRKEHRAEMVSAFQLQVSAFHFFQQAEIAILREAYKEARELLEMAVEMDGSKREYRALLKAV